MDNETGDIVGKTFDDVCKHDWSKEQDPGYRFCTKCNINYWDGHKMTEKDYKLKKLEKENKELTAQNEDYEKLGMEHIRVVKENKLLKDELYRTDLALMEVIKHKTKIDVAVLSKKYNLGIEEIK